MTGRTPKAVVMKFCVDPGENGLRDAETEFMSVLRMGFSDFDPNRTTISGPTNKAQKHSVDGVEYQLYYCGPETLEIGTVLSLTVDGVGDNLTESVSNLGWAQAIASESKSDIVVVSQGFRDQQVGGIVLGSRVAVFAYYLAMMNKLFRIPDELNSCREFSIQEFLSVVNSVLSAGGIRSVSGTESRRFVAECVDSIEKAAGPDVLTDRFGLTVKQGLMARLVSIVGRT